MPDGIRLAARMRLPVDAYFNGERIFSDQDVFSIPRDFM